MIRQFRYLQRKDLQEKLIEIEEIPLLMVIAPMGYGKSTVVREYLMQKEKRYIWITLGQNAVSEETMWNQVICGIYDENEALARQLVEIGPPSDSEREMTEAKLLDAVRNEFAGGDIYLVIDDYQAYKGKKINQFISRLVYEDIRGIHLILISRNTIEISFEEMRMKGYAAMIQQSDMILSPEETRQLFALNGIVLDDMQLNDIYAYTDGWIAAIRLLWLDYKETGSLQPSGSAKRLLQESVYSKLTEEEHKILFSFSCFPELSIEELAAVTELPVTEKIIKVLMEKTGLMHYNEQSRKYSIHTLLYNIVIEEKQENEKMYYARYAKYQHENGNEIQALDYFFRAGEREDVYKILECDKRFEIMEKIPEFMLNFFKRCESSKELLEHPCVVLSCIYIWLISADERILNEGRKFYKYIKEYYESQNQEDEHQRAIMSELLIVDSLVVFNDLAAANRDLSQAWELRGNRPSQIFSHKVYSYGVPNTLFMYHSTPGKLRQAVEDEIEYSRQYMRLIYNVEGSLAQLIEAEYEMDTGKTDEAIERAVAALQKAEFRHQTCMVLSSFRVIARALIYRGNKEGFEKTMDKCRQYMQGQNQKMLMSEYDLLLGYLYGIIGQLEKIPLWLRHYQFDNCNLIMSDSRNACIVYGIYLCKKKRWVKLDAMTEEMICAYLGNRHVFAEIYANIFMALSKWNMGDKEQAKERLKQAINLAEPDGICILFAELAEELIPLLEELMTQNMFAAKLYKLCKQWQKGIEAFKNEEYREALFTPREQELIEHLAEGCRNSEIGKRMNIAQVTVEKNLTSIYRKIGVSNRTGAIRWYNENRGGGMKK